MSAAQAASYCGRFISSVSKTVSDDVYYAASSGGASPAAIEIPRLQRILSGQAPLPAALTSVSQVRADLAVYRQWLNSIECDYAPPGATDVINPDVGISISDWAHPMTLTTFSENTAILRQETPTGSGQINGQLVHDLGNWAVLQDPSTLDVETGSQVVIITESTDKPASQSIEALAREILGEM